MKKIFYGGILLFAFACNSGGNTNNATDSATSNSVNGNSAGSNVIEMDTLHMDTSGHAISTESTHR